MITQFTPQLCAHNTNDLFWIPDFFKGIWLNHKHPFLAGFCVCEYVEGVWFWLAGCVHWVKTPGQFEANKVTRASCCPCSLYLRVMQNGFLTGAAHYLIHHLCSSHYAPFPRESWAHLFFSFLLPSEWEHLCFRHVYVACTELFILQSCEKYK